MNDDLTGGHVFVTAGDLTKLRCDALLVPTDGDFRITSSFSSLVGLSGDVRLSALTWPSGERVLRHDLAESGSAAVWLGRVTGSHIKATWIDDVAYEFVARAAESARHGSGPRRPLLALPVIGTGAGGETERSGAVARSLLDRLRVASDEHDADIVLVAWGRASYSAAQSVRHKEFRAGPSRSFDLGDSSRSGSLHSAAADLAATAKVGHLVLFIGAGVSAAAGLPAWQALVDGLANGLPDELKPDPAALRRLDLRDQAAILQRRYALAELEFHSALAAQVDQSHHGLTHELMASLSTTEAVTTNYDGLFEQAARVTGDSVAVLPTEPRPDADRWLLKLHGDLEHPKSMVLTREDYMSLPKSHGALFGLVQAMLMTRHMLFVGYSLSDEDFHQLVDEVRAARGAGPEGQRAFGTVLTLFDDPLFDTLWSADLRVLPMAPQPATPGEPTVEELVTAARRLQIFLDLVGLLAADRQAFLLDPSYEAILDDGEPALREALLALADHLPEQQDATWSQVRVLLGRMGYRGRNG